MLGEVFPGILGAVFGEGDKGIYVPVVVSKEPGKGNMVKFIDYLTTNHKSVKFPNVVNPKLAEILKKRGFTLSFERAEIYGEYVDVWVKEHQEMHISIYDVKGDVSEGKQDCS